MMKTMADEWTTEELLAIAKEFFNVPQKKQTEFCAYRVGVTPMTFRRWLSQHNIKKVITAEVVKENKCSLASRTPHSG